MKLLKFYASWCAPCKVLSQVMADAGDKITIPVEEIDIDNNLDTAIEYGVRSVPVLVLLDDDGKEVRRSGGVLMEDALLDFIQG